MKTICVTIALMLSASVFAQGQGKANKIKKLAREVSRLANQEAEYLSRSEKKALMRNLERSKAILMGYGTDTAPTRRSCDNDNANDFQAAFKTMKAFAYSSGGLDLSTTGSVEYATAWTSQFRCESAQAFIADFKKLKTFAYSSGGLDYSSTASVNFAKNNISKFCNNYDIEGEYKKHYQFAYSSGGLDYSSTASREYALGKIQRNAFSCRNRF